jgi:uncharacterized coiled-coil protein SlyX
MLSSASGAEVAPQEAAMSDERLTEIEIALAHQQAVADDLSAAAHALASRLDRLERLVQALTLRLAEAQAEAAAPPDPGARPPHW